MSNLICKSLQIASDEARKQGLFKEQGCPASRIHHEPAVSQRSVTVHAAHFQHRRPHCLLSCHVSVLLLPQF